MKQKLELPRRVDSPSIQKQKTQSKFGKIATDKSTSMRNKLENTLLENMNTGLTLETLVSLPPMDYNILDDMNKTHANISLFKLGKIQSLRDILMHALG